MSVLTILFRSEQANFLVGGLQEHDYHVGCESRFVECG